MSGHSQNDIDNKGSSPGDWGLGPIPNPQSPSPIPNPQSPSNVFIYSVLILSFLSKK